MIGNVAKIIARDILKSRFLKFLLKIPFKKESDKLIKSFLKYINTEKIVPI